VGGLIRVVGWRMASRMTARSCVLVELLGAIWTLEIVTFAGNGE
jgi:hypothetical protein